MAALAHEISEGLRTAEALVTEAINEGTLSAIETHEVALNTAGSLQLLLLERSQSRNSEPFLHEYTWLDVASPEYAEYLNNHIRELPGIVNRVKNDAATSQDVTHWYDALLKATTRTYENLVEVHANELPEEEVAELQKMLHEERIQAVLVREQREQMAAYQQNIDKVRAGAQEAGESLSDIRDAAGNTGAESLGHHFKEVADSERESATFWRWTGIALSGGLAALAFYGLVDTDLTAAVDVARRVIAGIPIAGLTGYVLRESGQHRRTARQYELASVQLRSLGAFVQPLPENDKASVRVALGTRVFGALDQSGSEEPTQPVLPVRDISDLLRSPSKEV